MRYFFLFLKGLGMGSADAVPGVSGGTVAFITGIYEELINSIRSFNAKAIRLLLSFKIAEFWKHINGTFLVVLLVGIATAILSLSKVIVYLLANYPEMLWAFFFGLIIASALVVSKQIKSWNVGVMLALLIGGGVGYLITIVTPTETPEALWFIFLSGMIAICAMILPGISGAFILLLLSKYEYIINAVSERKLGVIAVFMGGAVVGILAFSHLVNFMLKKFYSITVAFLTGLMLGSLNKVWPWKTTLTTYTDRHGEIKPLTQSNVLPNDYVGESYFWYCIILAIGGFLLVYLLEKFMKVENK